MPAPRRVYLPLQQHAGAPSGALVEVGDHVLKGQLLAEAFDRVSAPVHASISGTVVDVGDHVAPHPSGLPCRVIIIESDGLDQWIEAHPTSEPMALEPEEIARRVERAGVVGLGGAVFPAAVKLRQAAQRVETVIINAAECEPYLTCDDRVMQERTLGVIDGVRFILRALSAKEAVIGIEDNKPEAAEALTRSARTFPNIRVVVVPTRFPTGSSKQLVRILTGKEVPARARTTDIGIVMHNVSTAYAIHRAVRKDRALTSRVVTVSGGAIARPANVEVPLGTPIADVIAYCGGFSAAYERLVIGGPMTGLSITDLNAPVVKATSGILALTRQEVIDRDRSPCIRCARCVDACPMGLVPMEMSASARAAQWQVAVEFGLKDCIECGSCAFVCPSHIPLVSHFAHAKGELYASAAEDRKNAEIKQRMAARKERIEREQAEKAAAARARALARKAARQNGQGTPRGRPV